jgi:hypothetical protein
MASTEGIRFPFPTQPSARSPKLRIYESLFLLNQGVDHVVAILRSMEKFPFAHKDDLQCAQAKIEEARADVNADFVEELGNRERHDEGRFWKQRRAYEDKLKDPDDVYLSVEEREEERKVGPQVRGSLACDSAVLEGRRRRMAFQNGVASRRRLERTRRVRRDEIA